MCYTQYHCNSQSGERKTDNTVSYFSLTFSSQDKLPVVKGKYYALVMVFSK